MHCFTLVLFVLALHCASAEDRHPLNSESEPPHSKTKRALSKLLDPFGLLGKAGQAVSEYGESLHENAKQLRQFVRGKAKESYSRLQSRIQGVQDGLNEASQVVSIVGDDLIDSVSSLVSNNLGESQQNEEQGHLTQDGPLSNEEVNEVYRGDQGAQKREGYVKSFFRMFGVDTNQIGLFALNILIFLAELITSTLLPEEPPSNNDISRARSVDITDTLMDFVSTDAQLRINRFMSQLQDPALPRKTIERLQKSEAYNKRIGDTSCLQLLVCKVSPVVWGVQRVTQEEEHPSVMQVLFDSMPDVDDFMRFSNSCESQYPKCEMMHFNPF